MIKITVRWDLLIILNLSVGTPASPKAGGVLYPPAFGEVGGVIYDTASGVELLVSRTELLSRHVSNSFGGRVCEPFRREPIDNGESK